MLHYTHFIEKYQSEKNGVVEKMLSVLIALLICILGGVLVAFIIYDDGGDDND